MLELRGLRLVELQARLRTLVSLGLYGMPMEAWGLVSNIGELFRMEAQFGSV